MDNGFHASGILFHNFHSIRSSLSAVYDHRHIFLPGQFQLADKPLLLQVMSLFIPVVVQTDLADSHDFFTVHQFSHSLKIVLIQRSRLVRMNTDSSVHEGIFFRQFLYPVPGFNGRTGVYNCADPLCFHLPQQLFPVDVKLFIIIMCMCIKNHKLCSPLASKPEKEKPDGFSFCRNVTLHFMPISGKFQRFSAQMAAQLPPASFAIVFYSTRSSIFSNPSNVYDSTELPQIR